MFWASTASRVSKICKRDTRKVGNTKRSMLSPGKANRMHKMERMRTKRRFNFGLDELDERSVTHTGLQVSTALYSSIHVTQSTNMKKPNRSVFSNLQTSRVKNVDSFSFYRSTAGFEWPFGHTCKLRWQVYKKKPSIEF